MHIYDYPQGSPEWHTLRAGCFTASQASILMGCQPHQSRNDMLRTRAGGSEQEFSAWEQKHLLERGHQIEALARPLAEAILGEELIVCTGVTDPIPGLPLPLLASFDGVDSLHLTVWECKSWNKEKAAAVMQGCVPACDYWQVVQQVYVAQAERALYMVTDGTMDNTVHCWYERNEADEALLIGAWALFADDMNKVAPARHIAPVAKAAPGLPMIRYQVNGLAIASNLDEFRAAAAELVAESKQPLNTDQEFADREALCKGFAEAESKIKLLGEQVLGQFYDVERFIRELNETGELIRQARLASEKLIKQRKDEIKAGISQEAEQALADHLAALNAKLPPGIVVPPLKADFIALMKGLRNRNSIQDKVDAEVARLKLLANQQAERIASNHAIVQPHLANHGFLFHDLQALVELAPDSLLAVVAQRISEHDARMAESQRLREAVTQSQAANDPEPATPRTPAAPRYQVKVIDMTELAQAVANGEVPESVLSVDYQALTAVCASRGQAVPGTTWNAA